jgi:hypothetical protein
MFRSRAVSCSVVLHSVLENLVGQVSGDGGLEVFGDRQGRLTVVEVGEEDLALLEEPVSEAISLANVGQLRVRVC